jgi:hypothetical protein
MKMFSMLIATAVCASGLAGCSSGASDTATPATSGSHPSSASSSPTPSQVPPSPSAIPDRLLRKSQLRAAIVGIDQLPAGYSVDRDQSGGKTTKTFCDYKVPQKEKITAARDFIKGGGLSTQLIVVRLRQYASAGAASESFAALTHAIKTCHGERYSGQKLHYSVMSAPKLGDGAVGVRIEYDNGTNLSYFVLDGPLVMNVAGGGLVDVNADQITSVLKAQVNAYEDAAAP